MNVYSPPPPMPDVWVRAPGRMFTIGQEVTVFVQGSEKRWMFRVLDIESDAQGPLYRVVLKELQTLSE